MTDLISLALTGVRELQPYQPGKPIEELEREKQAAIEEQAKK